MERIQDARKLGGVERLADHTRRSEIDLALAAADGGSGGLRSQRCGLATLDAGKGVGIAGIHDDCAGHAVWQIGAAVIDRRGRALRAGEDPRDGRRLVEHHHQDVRSVLVLDPRGGGSHANAADGRHGGKGFRSERGNGTGHEDRPG